MNALSLISVILIWTRDAVATCYEAVTVGGVLILVAERLRRKPEPSDDDVRRAAELYRQWYGKRALSAIGDHMLAARFAPEVGTAVSLNGSWLNFKPASP